MRDSLTVLAILLIVLLTAALVVPYFIDWSGHRAFIEAKLTAAAGARVTIEGPIDLKLLPQPTIRLGQVTIGETGPGQQSLTAARLDAQVALTALMRGDIEVADVTLQSPRLDLSAAANGTLHVGLPTIADPQRVKFQHFAITDGTLTVADPERGTVTLSGLDLDGEATTLLGPFKVTGRYGPGQDRHGFRLSTGAFESGRMRLKLGIDAARDRPAIDLDGTVIAGGGSATTGKSKPAGPQFDGTLALSGAVPLAATPATIPWRLTTKLLATRDAAALTDLELRTGADLQGLVATGSGEAALGERPELRLQLHGAHLNFDALAMAPDGSTVPPPAGLDLVARLARMAADRQAGAGRLPARFDLDYTLDTASAGAQSIFGISGGLRLDGDAPAQIRIAASGPDGAHLAADGRLEGGSAPVFRGRVDAGLRDLGPFADWLAPALPEVAARAKRMIPARSVSFGGLVDISAIGGSAREATLTLDRTSLKGTLSYTDAVGTDRARLFADLGADALDLDDLPDVGGGAFDWSGLDLDVALTASAVKIASVTLGAAGAAPVEAGQIALRLHKTGDAARLDRFAADFGGAKLTATGTLDAATASAMVLVDAPDLGPIADLLAHAMPGSATTVLKSRAAELSPARLDLNVEALRGPDGGLLPNVLSVTGRANGTDIEAEVKPDRAGDLDPDTASVSARLLATSSQSLTLLRQLGLPLAPGTSGPGSRDPGRIEGRAHGSLATGFDAALDATLSGTAVAFRGKAKPQLGSGHLSLNGGDLAPLLASAGLLAAGGQQAWPVRGEADMSWHDSSVALRHLSGQLAGVAFGGDLNTDLAPPPPGKATRPVLFGTLAVDRLDLSTLFGLALGVPGPRPAGDEAPPALPSLWSSQPYGPAALRLPRTEIAVKSGNLAVLHDVDARAASFTLKAEAGALTLADLTGTVAGGSLGGSLTLRHDGSAASVFGTLSLSGIAVDLPGLSGRVGGSLDIAGSGASPAALVASLAGTGSVLVANGRLAAFDPAALARAARAAERNSSDIDADQVGQTLIAELDRAPLPVGDAAGPAALAGGVLRLGPLHTDGGGWAADTDLSVDIRTFEAQARSVLKVRQPLPDWRGEPAQATLVLKGLPAAPEREVDAVAFVNALQSRAIARDQERIDVIQQDIRERAFFNRRLKSIEADQKLARERAKVEADARAAAELERLLDQDKLRPMDLQSPRTPGGPGPTATGGAARPAPASRPPPLPPVQGRAPPQPGPAASKPRPMPPRPSSAPPGFTGPNGQDPSVEGRY